MTRNTVNIREQNKELRAIIVRKIEENTIFRKMIVRLYNHGIITGLYGPWHDDWNEEDNAMWGKIDDWKEELGIE